MKEITFKERKENHFYAKREKNGRLVVIETPKVGQKVFEIPFVKGG